MRNRQNGVLVYLSDAEKQHLVKQTAVAGLSVGAFSRKLIMGKEISHEGKIVEITPDFTSVEIVSSSACSACHAKGLCGFSESETKLVMVPTDPYTERKVGDIVDLVLKPSMGLKAVWISYVIPLAVLMILILLLSRFVESEVWVAAGSVAGVALYYFIIWLLRDRLKNEFVFCIR